MKDFNKNEKHLLADLGVVLNEQMLQSNEKFKIWESKSYAERQSAFKKVGAIGQYSQDQLSIWVAEQMDILLAKSVFA